MVTFNLLRKELEKDSALSEKNECYFCPRICNAVLLDSRAAKELIKKVFIMPLTLAGIIQILSICITFRDINSSHLKLYRNVMIYSCMSSILNQKWWNLSELTYTLPNGTGTASSFFFRTSVLLLFLFSSGKRLRTPWSLLFIAGHNRKPVPGRELFIGAAAWKIEPAWKLNVYTLFWKSIFTCLTSLMG